jgi:hypothetical protein
VDIRTRIEQPKRGGTIGCIDNYILRLATIARIPTPISPPSARKFNGGAFDPSAADRIVRLSETGRF